MSRTVNFQRISTVLMVAVFLAIIVVSIAKRPSTTWYARDADSDETLKILFIGNSLTYYHDMPGVVVEMFQHAHPDQKLKVAMVTGPGFKLSQHLRSGDAIEMIEKEGPWDWVVLQEHGGLTYSDPDEAARSLKSFAEASRQAGAQPIVYLDWHSAAVPNHESLLEQIATKLDLSCVPVAQAWHKSRELHPEIQLLMDDDVHPTAAGAYLIALVFYASLSQDHPSGLPAGDLSEQDTRNLQDIAWEAVNGKVRLNESSSGD